MPFKKTIFFLLLVGLCAGGWFYMLPRMAKQQVEAYLTAAGYRPYAIGDIVVQPPYILASRILLDRDGFNSIGLLRAKVADMSLTPVEVRIDDIRTATMVESPASIFRLIGSFQKSLPAGDVQIEKITSDFATPYGDLRLEATMGIDAADESGNRALRAVVRARQFQLSFDTRWSGTIAPNGNMVLDADILDGRMNIGPARLSRLVGWFNWNGESADVPIVTGQIDVGSGTIFGLPLQNISATIGGTARETDIMFRTGLSGTNSALLSMDTKVSAAGTRYDAALDIKDTETFFAHVQTLQPKTVPEALRFLGPLRVYMNYREDRRFTGGPLPFELRAQAAGKNIVDGNILIYPDAFELRGSAQMDETLAIAVQEYFSIAADKRTGGALRLDGDIRALFAPDKGESAPDGSGVGAGVENNLGE